MDALYRDGEFALYKIIYRQLVSDNHQPGNSTRQLEFSVPIDINGKPDINSLEAKNDYSKQYVSSVKTALSKLETDFIPRIQNLKAVNSSYTIQFNY